ncbi:hypothetical protein MIDIC_30010 [Alphaproteobacteria bacterium]
MDQSGWHKTKGLVVPSNISDNLFTAVFSGIESYRTFVGAHGKLTQSKTKYTTP